MRAMRIPGGRQAVILVTGAALLLGLSGCHYHHVGRHGYGGGPVYGYSGPGYGYRDGGHYGRGGYGYGYGYGYGGSRSGHGGGWSHRGD